MLKSCIRWWYVFWGATLAKNRGWMHGSCVLFVQPKWAKPCFFPYDVAHWNLHRMGFFLFFAQTWCCLLVIDYSCPLAEKVRWFGFLISLTDNRISVGLWICQIGSRSGLSVNLKKKKKRKWGWGPHSLNIEVMLKTFKYCDIDISTEVSILNSKPRSVLSCNTSLYRKMVSFLVSAGRWH